ncbi:MAG: hypothetical protein MI861_18110, partial [Pirellulales bacterium]|nr:hypothetical protein [Pirellulales bacterium]
MRDAKLTLLMLGTMLFWASAAAANDFQRVSHLIKVLQDEDPAIPIDYVYQFKNVDVLLNKGPRRSDQVALQDVTNSRVAVAGDDEFKDSQVFLIQADGSRKRLTADKNGLVKLRDLISGINVLVASTRSMHGVMTFLVDDPNDPKANPGQQGDAAKAPLVDKPKAAQQAPAEQTPTKVMALIPIQGKNVLSIVGSYLPSPGPAVLGGIDERLKSGVDGGNQFGDRVVLGPGGKLSGQLISFRPTGKERPKMADTNVVLVRDGKRVGRVLSDQRGRFEFADVRPGTYGVIAAGSGGYAAF